MLRVRTVFTGPPGTPWLSTMYFQGNTQADADNAVVDVTAFWNAVDAGITSSASWSTEPDVADLDIATGDLVQSFSTTPGVGSGASAGDMLPTASQALVRWVTPGVVAGRRVRGRTFVPGVTEAFAAAGRPIAAYLTTLNTAAAALIASGTSNFSIWSRPVPGRVGTAHSATSGSGWSDFAVMRSRRD